MANNFLDYAGLARVVNKIKELIPSKTSELDNDSGFITIEDVPEGGIKGPVTWGQLKGGV